MSTLPELSYHTLFVHTVQLLHPFTIALTAYHVHIIPVILLDNVANSICFYTISQLPFHYLQFAGSRLHISNVQIENMLISHVILTTN